MPCEPEVLLDRSVDDSGYLLLCYGQPERNIQAETYFGNVNCFGPRSCYDEGKRVAEALAFAYRVQHPDSPELRIARIFNAYGPGMHASDGRVVTNFIGAALRGENLVITGDGKSTRCFQYVEDCVAGLTSLMESSWEHGPVNIGCDKETTIQELAELVAKTVSDIAGGSQVGIVYGDPLPDDPLQRRPDCTLAKKVLGWNVKTNLVEGLRRTIDWHIAVSKK
ncbi:hypothetical protein CBER1_10046 [Cercospora berteroae]|uniref:UDP-glucuronate decarboxylase n=1 Tax=Cercospora berteroae TaxID=357750 RepID=A0A2S6BX91_9PEZI|nr:hypothetical protein CBER1_10046 [Cercospora berteroae]